MCIFLLCIYSNHNMACAESLQGNHSSQLNIQIYLGHVKGISNPLSVLRSRRARPSLRLAAFEVCWSCQGMGEYQFILGRRDASLKIHEESVTFVQSGLNQNQSAETGPKWKHEKWAFNNITALNIDVINLYSRAEASMECWESFERSS